MERKKIGQHYEQNEERKDKETTIKRKFGRNDD